MCFQAPVCYPYFRESPWEEVWEMGRLSAATVKALTAPGRHGDGDGLMLVIGASGAKSWVLRISRDGHRYDLGLGSAKVVSLAEARERALERRAFIAKGGDPRASKRRRSTPTFEKAVAAVIAKSRAKWRNEKHAHDWERTLENHAGDLRKMRVDRIEKKHVLDVLDPIWTEKPETARRVRQRIRRTLGWALSYGYVEHNVAGEVLDGALPPQPRIRAHFRSAPFVDVPDIFAAVERSEASQATKCCLRFLILTAARSGEAREARWSDIDRDGRKWELPSERMKAGVPHRVPLSDQALDVLKVAKSLRDDSDLAFPSPINRGAPLSNVTLNNLLKKAGFTPITTIHGFRASFRTWAEERTDASWAACEAALAHRVGGPVARAYIRSDLLEERRELMQKWADFLEGGDG